ncbi:hypothetical protein [Bifidobacterium castoris]|uniref:Uncharacterized protein n=1 Tax=Bifidobacterium castoris TaxID=2306972 RepID=A0A430FAC6_9BIFI|nr:hypothetical protein [Bifidobacterium castoris]RSX49752.1 hypothetical protein D2E22_0213 [Bifidobacterium castoris]
MMDLDDMMAAVRGPESSAAVGRTGMSRWVDDGPLRLSVHGCDGRAHALVRAYGLHDLTVLECRNIPVSAAGARWLAHRWEEARSSQVRRAAPRELLDTALILGAHGWVTVCSAHGLTAARPGVLARWRPVRDGNGRLRACTAIVEDTAGQMCTHVDLSACLPATARRDRLLAAVASPNAAAGRPCGDAELLMLDAERP